MEGTKLTVEEASKLMGVSKQFIRAGLQQGILPFGYAVQISKGRYTYYISKQKLLEHTGINELK
jgi:excisionase family DNA binding protein